MAIKINLNTTVIPVEIGQHKFEINMTDEKEVAFQTKLNKFLTDIQELNEEKPEDTEKLTTLVADVLDSLLGVGSFDTLYKEVPNTGILLGVLMDLVTEFSKEAKNRVMPKSILRIMDKKQKK